MPIAPTRIFLLRVRLLAASLARSSELDCRLVVTISRDVEPYDLYEAEPWSRASGVEWRWTTDELYDAYGIYGTAMARFTYEYQRPFVLMLDADTLCTGSLRELPARSGGGIGGVMAWVTPLLEPPVFRSGAAPAAGRFWCELFASAGLPAPLLDQEHPGWHVMHGAPDHHRHAPPYFNLGMLAGKAETFAALGPSVLSELDAVDAFADTRFRCQLALTLAAARSGTPLVPLPLRFNFPNSRWFWEGHAEERDVRLLHYVETDEIDREALRTLGDLTELTQRSELSPPNALMREHVLALLNQLTPAEGAARLRA